MSVGFTNVRVTALGDRLDKVECLDTGKVKYVQRNEKGDRYWTVDKPKEE